MKKEPSEHPEAIKSSKWRKNKAKKAKKRAQARARQAKKTKRDNERKDKELALKGKALALKEKQLALKEEADKKQLLDRALAAHSTREQSRLDSEPTHHLVMGAVAQFVHGNADNAMGATGVSTLRDGVEQRRDELEEGELAEGDDWERRDDIEQGDEVEESDDKSEVSTEEQDDLEENLEESGDDDDLEERNTTRQDGTKRCDDSAVGRKKQGPVKTFVKRLIPKQFRSKDKEQWADKETRDRHEQSVPKRKLDMETSGERVPKKARRVGPPTSCLIDFRPCLWQIHDFQSVVGKKVAQFDLSDLEFRGDGHPEDRLDVRAGTDRSGGLKLMNLGELRLNKYNQLEIFYLDERGVEHVWPLTVRSASRRVIVETYFPKSPFRTDPSHRPRRHDMLRKLEWLSSVLGGISLKSIGRDIAQAIDTLDYEKLHCPNPHVIDVVETILPTDEELALLGALPYACEMGDPERWIVAIGKVAHACKTVEMMRAFCWSWQALRKGETMIFYERQPASIR